MIPQHTTKYHKKADKDTTQNHAMLRIVEYLRPRGYTINLNPVNGRIMHVIEVA